MVVLALFEPGVPVLALLLPWVLVLALFVVGLLIGVVVFLGGVAAAAVVGGDFVGVVCGRSSRGMKFSFPTLTTARRGLTVGVVLTGVETGRFMKAS